MCVECAKQEDSSIVRLHFQQEKGKQNARISCKITESHGN